MENISWIDRERNEEVLHRIKKERNILHTIKRKTNWTGGIWRRNCVLKHIIEGNMERRIEVMERRGIKSKQLLEDLKETGGCRKLKPKHKIVLCGALPLEETNGPVIRQLRNE
jgi:hypothetical protein